MAAKETFEKSLARLESIVEKLEEPELPLDKSIKLFEEGVKQVRHCEKKLEQAEGKVEKLMKENGLFKKEPYESKL